VSSRMHAIRQLRFGGPEVLEYVEITRPSPGAGEVLVRVAAAGVNPADWKIRDGLVHRGEPPLTLGMDLAGEVTGLGADVTGFELGDQVFGCAWPPHGAYA
jgi:NADPH:quinone reductase-like Zn-dependent oxidoreductase